MVCFVMVWIGIVLYGLVGLVMFGNVWECSTGCPKKNYTLFWRAVAPLNFELGIKVRGVLESSVSQLFKTVPTFDF